MADPLCRICGRIALGHPPGVGPGTHDFDPAPDEPKRCTCGATVFCNCPTHGPNRPEPAKEAGQELPREWALWTRWHAGLQRGVPMRFEELLALMPTLSAEQQYAIDAAVHGAQREVRTRFRLEIARLESERDAANQRADEAEQGWKEEAAAHSHEIRECDKERRAWSLEREKYRPLVEAARDLAAKFPDDGTGMVNGVLDLSAVYSALRALDASPDAGLVGARIDEREAATRRYIKDLERRCDELTDRLAEAEGREAEQISLKGRFAGECMNLRAELSTVVQRTARAQREACARACGNTALAISYAGVISKVPLVSLEDLPQEKATCGPWTFMLGQLGMHTHQPEWIAAEIASWDATPQGEEPRKVPRIPSRQIPWNDDEMVGAYLKSEEPKAEGDEGGPDACRRCGNPYALRPGDEPTPYCDPCAHARVEELEQRLADPKVPPVFQERIDRLRAKCSRQRKELRRFN